MKKYLKFIIKNSIEFKNDEFLENSIEFKNDEFLENSIEFKNDEFLENSIKFEENINEIELENKKINLFTWTNLFYVISIVSFIGVSIYLYNTDWFITNKDYLNNIGHLKELDNIGINLYKLSSELSKSCTVHSWEIIHKILKDLEKGSFNNFELITELEKLKKINSIYPGQFSTNHDSFEKSLIKLINFLNEIL